jgi:hypothetical protein
VQRRRFFLFFQKGRTLGALRLGVKNGFRKLFTDVSVSDPTQRGFLPDCLFS